MIATDSDSTSVPSTGVAGSDSPEETPAPDGPEKPKIHIQTQSSTNPHRHNSDSSERTLTAAATPRTNGTTTPRPAAVVAPVPPPTPAPTPPIHPVKRTKSDSTKTNGVLKRMFRPSAPNTPVTEVPLPFNDRGRMPNAPPNGHGPEYFEHDRKLVVTTTPPTPESERSWASPTPSRSPSRAASVASAKADGRSSRKSSFSRDGPPPVVVQPPSSGSRSRAPSVGSDGGQRFTLKDLLANSPKLARKSSGSRKSDYSSGASETSTSLLKKYGVCERVAIGKGATSVVRLAHKWDRTEEKLYAVKEFRKRRKNETEKEYVKKLTSEFCIASTLHHKNIVETVDLVQDENHNWCEVMEYCPGGDLYAAIKKGGMSPSEVECCFKQILLGISYLHAQGVAHRDIKPENLFFDNRGLLKIGDYGASTVYRLPWEGTVHMSNGLCGSEPYIAPEQFLHKPYDARLVDIWAVGVVYYCLLFQELPWRVAQTTDPLYASYASACAASPFPAPPSSPISPSSPTSPKGHSHVHHHHHHATNPSAAQYAAMSFPTTITNISPRAARPLLRRILEPDPKLRASIEEVIAHPWLDTVEVCTEVAKPSHQHSSVRAALGQPVIIESPSR